MNTEQLQEQVNQLEERVAILEQKVAAKEKRPFGTPLEEVKKLMGKPFERSEETIEKMLSIIGIGEGPEDLSVNLRAYLRGEKK